MSEVERLMMDQLAMEEYSVLVRYDLGATVAAVEARSTSNGSVLRCAAADQE
jgi:hypothetical protein